MFKECLICGRSEPFKPEGLPPYLNLNNFIFDTICKGCVARLRKMTARDAVLDRYLEEMGEEE